MQSSSTLKKHASLVDQMATARGVDLQEQALRGTVSIDEISDAVLSCTNCTSPGACSGWLAQQTEPSDTSPEYCRNTVLFDRLSRA